MRFATLTGLMLLAAVPLSAQDPQPVRFAGTACTEDQIAAGALDSPDRPDSVELGRLEPPELRVPLPQDDFHPPSRQSTPMWVNLRFVVDTAGLVDLCTVYVLRANDSKWTTFVLSHLAKVRYRPALQDGHPRRLLMATSFLYGGRRR